MFTKDNIKYNMMMYLMIYFSSAFAFEYSLVDFITRPQVLITIIINSLWLVANIMREDKNKSID